MYEDAPDVPEGADYVIDFEDGEHRSEDFATLSEGDAIEVVYEPTRGVAKSKSKSGVVTNIQTRNDQVSAVNADTGDEYDDGTPKTFEFNACVYGRPVVKSHGRKQKTRLGDVNRVVVTRGEVQ